MASFRDLLAQAKSQIIEIDTAAAQKRIEEGKPRRFSTFANQTSTNRAHFPTHCTFRVDTLRLRLKEELSIATRQSLCIAQVACEAHLLHKHCKNLGTPMFCR
jgi:hypothetical protein